MSQRNNLLDFIKGAAIVSVLFIHALSDDTKEAISYWYHIGQAVPLFLMVTSYLAYKKPVRLFSEQYKNKIIKVLKHIFIPFVADYIRRQSGGSVQVLTAEPDFPVQIY